MKIDYTRYYGRWHNDSPEHLAQMLRYFGGRLEPLLPPDRHARVLDVGCGMGFALEALRARGFDQLAGIEPDQAQAEAARRRGFDVATVDDSISWLRARPASCDLVLLLDVLEHVPRDSQLELVAAIYGTLTPGGGLICSVPNANAALAARQRHMDWTHHASFTEHSLDFVLYHGGFRQIEIRADDGPPKPWPWLPLWRRRWWYVRGLLRFFRRLQLMAELGPEEGKRAPLSLNLLGTAVK